MSISQPKWEKSAIILLVTGTDWKVIPLENLIAELQRYKVKIIFGVKSAEEARLAFQTLETGADGVLLDSGNPQEIKDTIKAARELESESAELESAVVTRVEPLGMGDRVCVDTCNLMQTGEGMLIGSQASGMFLVNSESDDSPYVAARPFRVNAGAVHSYIKIGDKTRYLSELQTGDTVTIVDSKGKQREGIVGRVKIESRPLMLIEAKAGDRTLSCHPAKCRNYQAGWKRRKSLSRLPNSRKEMKFWFAWKREPGISGKRSKKRL